MSEVSRRLDAADGQTNPPAFRTRPEVARFFEGLELLAGARFTKKSTRRQMLETMKAERTRSVAS